MRASGPEGETWGAHPCIRYKYQSQGLRGRVRSIQDLHMIVTEHAHTRVSINGGCDIAMMMGMIPVSRLFMKILMDKGEYQAAPRSGRFGGNNHPGREFNGLCKASNHRGADSRFLS